MLVRKHFLAYTSTRKNEYRQQTWRVNGLYLFGFIPLYVIKELYV